MNDPRKKNDDEDDEDFVPFQDMDKGIVLQEKSLFNATPLDARKCCHLITKYLHLITQGDVFTTKEATDVFFAVTKLFQSKDMVLRRMVYLILKELAPFAEDVIIVISSLTKDMNSNVDVFRANAIRVLCCILEDMSILGQGERYLKQAIVDKEPQVASSALVSGIHLLGVASNTDIVKRWINEIQDAAKSTNRMVQYHALGLLYQLKKRDRLAVTKLVISTTRSSVRSPHAHCLLIRITADLLADQDPDNRDQILVNYLESCSRHTSDMVEFEAARAICSMPNATPRDLTHSVSVLKMFLVSPKAVLRFAAVRTLNKVAMLHPVSVTTCNLDMENLLADSNRSIATYAITTLLKTGRESTIDRLMKQISTFMNEISDEFKVVVVEAIHSLCTKFPGKHRALMGFLSNILRDEGGYEYKRAIVDAILEIIHEIPAAKETGLTHLCEFIEDCEFTQLATTVLHVLGEEGPTTQTPQKYIRYIFNRVILENAVVRAAAVSAIAKFGYRVPALRESVIVLLRRCLVDDDDEVRDRATMHLKLILARQEEGEIQDEILTPITVPLVNLEKELRKYIQHPSTTPFDMASVPQHVREPAKAKSGPGSKVAREVHAGEKQRANSGATQLAHIPELAALGKPFKSSASVSLSEKETEYVVNCVKHVFAGHVVFQFTITNTLNDQQLEDAVVKMEQDGDALVFECEIAAKVLAYDAPGQAFTVFRRAEETFVPDLCSFNNTLKYKVKDVDPSTGVADEEGYDDEYALEEIELETSDFVQSRYNVQFQNEWEALGEDNECVQTYGLSSVKSCQAAVAEITSYLGMKAVDNTDQVPEDRTKHILYLAGKMLGDVPVLARVRMKAGPSGVNLELTSRSTEADASNAIATAL
eukprot:TRINITY_DN15205_c0_g1_i1.p1 TRINITY_DN15205_c0_g1~~TRINITY_DN15205_c0_g1_i1.p1  ORF type:complete len:879 (-),score=289.91 TRINITY_DN15205_c0_g1_i1:79-2715(-)